MVSQLFYIWTKGLYISGKGWMRCWCCRPPACIKQIINVTVFKYILGGMGEYVCAKWVLIFPYVEMCLKHRVPVQITRVGQCWRDGCQNKLWDSFHFQQDLELEAPTWTGGHLQTSARLCDFCTYKVVVLHATSTLNREETLTHILQRWILAF